jgi:choline dehydrogenase-like flavoprotein
MQWMAARRPGGGCAVIVDFRDPSSPTDIEADLCIVGGGPAGISIARSFIGSAVDVCLLESGGLDAEPPVQDLYRAVSAGPQELDARNSRLRAFGGGSEVWGGGCIPLTEIDFAPRDWVPDSGWPLTYERLRPYYAQARALFRLDRHDFAEGSFLGAVARRPPDFDGRLLVHRNFACSPVHFGSEYADGLRRAGNVRVLLHANLIAFDASADARAVRQARIGSLGGRRGTVRAKQYVLACGGIENARLLLLSGPTPAGGLGNRHGLVGRYFMDHPSGRIGRLYADAPDRVTRAYDRSGGNGEAPLFPELCVADAAQRSLRLLNARARPLAVLEEAPEGLQALRRLRQAMRRPTRFESMASVLEPKTDVLALRRKDGTLPRMAKALDRSPAALAKEAAAVGLGIGDVARAFARKLADAPTVRTAGVDVDGYFEQAPNPDSRIVLDDGIDALGQRRARVDWRLTPLDWHTYRTSARIFGDELARVSGGRFVLEPWLADAGNTVADVHGTSHHIGTTRMDADPRKGVVDTDARVHGVDNLYVAGSSVFPTGGWAFPTFTIVAMSLRLAEHLHARLRTAAPVAVAAN